MKQQFAAKHPWTILAAGAAIQVLTGLPAAWGVFQQPVIEEYGLSEQGAGYAFALLIAAFGVGCVLGGFLQDKKGPRCAALWAQPCSAAAFSTPNSPCTAPARQNAACFSSLPLPCCPIPRSTSQSVLSFTRFWRWRLHCYFFIICFI